MIRTTIEILCSYYEYMMLLVLLLLFCIASTFENMPQGPKIVDFLESNDKEEVNSKENVKQL